MQLSILSEALKTQRYFAQSQIQNKRKVKVYIRTVTRKSIKIQLPSQIQLNQLQDIILQKFNILKENQIIYLKGVCINFNSLVFLQNNWIVHAINLAQVNLPSITIDIKTTVFKIDQESSTKVTFNPNVKIKEFIENQIICRYEIKIQETLLVESGRILKQNLTFIEQNVQNGTSINLIHSTKDISSSIKHRSILLHQQKFEIPQKQTSNYQSQKRSVSLSSIEDPCHFNAQKSTQTKFCQIHHNLNIKKQKNMSQKNLKSSLKSSKIKPELSESLNLKNKIIQIGERQCNCKKEPKSERKIKFITQEDKKKLSKEIRQQNLNKVMKSRNNKNQIKDLQKTTPKRKLIRVNSLYEIESLPVLEKTKSLKFIHNPERNTIY